VRRRLPVPLQRWLTASLACSVYRLALEWARLVNDDRDASSFKG